MDELTVEEKVEAASGEEVGDDEQLFLGAGVSSNLHQILVLQLLDYAEDLRHLLPIPLLPSGSDPLDDHHFLAALRRHLVRRPHASLPQHLRRSLEQVLVPEPLLSHPVLLPLRLLSLLVALHFRLLLSSPVDAVQVGGDED